MPTYEYRCTECGHTHEAFQKITAAPLTTCPSCQKAALQRGVGGGSATFRFVGEGFYINDYKKECPSSDTSCSCKE